MKDCPNCEYHKARAQRWREEAYKHAGHPLPEREWVGLTDKERKNIMVECESTGDWAWELNAAKAIEAKLKEKNSA